MVETIFVSDTGLVCSSSVRYSCAVRETCAASFSNARFQSASDLAFNLEGLLGVPSTRAATVASAESHPSTRVMPLALGAVLLVLIAGGSWMLGRRTASAALPFTISSHSSAG